LGGKYVLILRKILAITALIIAGVPVTAQFSFRIIAGLNASTQTAKNYHLEYAKNTFLWGFNAGTSIDYSINRWFSLSFSPVLESKGTRGKDRQSGISADVKNRLLYFDLPASMKARFRISGLDFFVYFGAYAGYGLTGKAWIETADTTKTWKISWGSGTRDDFRRFDYGITGGAGIKLNKISFEIMVANGLANIYAVKQIGYIIENKSISLSFGYLLP